MKLEIVNFLERSPLQMSEALAMMVSFAQALSELHASGEFWDHCESGVEVLPTGVTKIHGTVSARNARLNDGDVDPNRSVAPPEFIQSEAHDARSDIFAWGIVSYELVTGVCPLKGESITELIQAAMACDFPPPHRIREEWPERLSRIISKAIAKDPLDRYQSADELLYALSTR